MCADENSRRGNITKDRIECLTSLPGPKGQRFDYLTMDQEDHLLLSAHLGPGILYVVDARANTLVRAIPGVPGITGVE